LYGDDDTFFFVDGILELLQDFDPELPYFITGTALTLPCSLYYCVSCCGLQTTSTICITYDMCQDVASLLTHIVCHDPADHYWWGDELNESMNYHPHERAPRCLPCHWSQEDEERALRADGYRPFQPYIGCPCTAERICRTDDRGFFNDACDIPIWQPDSEGRDFRVYT